VQELDNLRSLTVSRGVKSPSLASSGASTIRKALEGPLAEPHQTSWVWSGERMILRLWLQTKPSWTSDLTPRAPGSAFRPLSSPHPYRHPKGQLRTAQCSAWMQCSHPTH
jgi:hypothetical protein